MSLFQAIVDFFTATGSTYAEQAFDGPLRDPVCPTCNQGLSQLNAADVIFKICSTCSGIWVDKECFSGILKKEEEELDPYFSYTEENLDIRMNYMTPADTRKCPVCDTTMMNIEYDSSSGIWLDHCPHNHGIWLDAGEINLVLQYKKLLKEHGGKIPGQVIGMTEEFKKEMEENVGGFKVKGGLPGRHNTGGGPIGHLI